ncbi:MAG TPA: acetyl-CoA C-acetyltransferase [Candidatus Polarisedimenticolaceae bacterium]|nr:acetyl-CoA C-acetyltransferase [Candidatus Polarisedimenticolaceae bacterium]
MEQVFLVSAVRTPIGRFLGALAPLSATQLGAIAVREAVKRAGIEPSQVEEVVMGNVVQAGLGQNPARQAALFAGLPDTIPAATVNKVCGSGLKAVMMAAQAIKAGDAHVIVAGGMESMSNAPYLVRNARTGFRMGHQTMEDSMIHDGLWDVYNDYHMGNTGEVVAERYHVSREQQDAYAYDSHRKAVAAMDAGKFKDEIVPVEVPGKKEPVRVTMDENPRRDTSLEALAKLKPAFKKEGTVTAGNAPPVNDAASATVVVSETALKRLGLTPIARVVAYSASGLAPELVMMAPEPAIRKVWEKTGWKNGDVDLYEINEAFSVQQVAMRKVLDLDPAKHNVLGGAVALGHPIGCSGTRVLTTLVHALHDRKEKRGIAALCLGGGNAVAMAVEV